MNGYLHEDLPDTRIVTIACPGQAGQTPTELWYSPSPAVLVPPRCGARAGQDQTRAGQPVLRC